MDNKLLDILVCPECKGPLLLMGSATDQELVCKADRVAYPVIDSVPVMLIEEARALDENEVLD